MQYIAITGRQPELAIAEIEAQIGSEPIKDTFKDIILLDQNIDLTRFGSIQKVLEVVSDDKNYSLLDYIALYCQNNSINKINLGVSSYGVTVNKKSLFEIKKTLKSNNIKTRLILPKDSSLSAAEHIYNKLKDPNKGLEIALVRMGGKTYTCKVLQVQDINSYSKRDRDRPMRDTKVGMLPPKLAQIIINLATNEETSEILDPFCGTGVILQESLLLDHNAYGTDISKEMVEYSHKNLQWLTENYQIDGKFRIEVGDAQSYQWGAVDTVAAETYLGKNYSQLPTEQDLEKEIDLVNNLLVNFLKNIGNQIETGTRLCLGIPQWKINKTIYTLPLIDNIEHLGYTWVNFEHVDSKNLVYRRSGQLVGRQMLILIKK